MNNKAQAAPTLAIIKRDLQSIASNKRMLSILIVVPLVITVMIPSIFILTILLTPEDSPDILQLLQMLDSADLKKEGGFRGLLVNMILNYVLPLFFLLIPVMASSVMASGSFVGEKEKKTLETLLYSPVPLKDIFGAKILASFLLSMAVSFLSFIIMIIVVESLLFAIMRAFVMPNINWIIMMILVSPAASLIAINLIVRNSTKAQSSEEAQQSSVFLVLPIVLLAVSQFTGVMLLGAHIFLILGTVLAVLAAALFKGSLGKINYETMLK